MMNTAYFTMYTSIHVINIIKGTLNCMSHQRNDISYDTIMFIVISICDCVCNEVILF